MPAPEDVADASIPGRVVDREVGDGSLDPDLVRDRPLRDRPVVELDGSLPTPGPAPFLGQADQEWDIGATGDRPSQFGLALGGMS